MEERRRNLLKKLEGFFQEDEDIEEVSLFEAKELNTPMDMVRALVTGYGPKLMDILAEFSFLPLGGEDEVWYFTSILTILTEIPPEAVPAVSGAIAKLNFYLPYGNFALSTDGEMLIYRSVAALRSDHDDQILYDDIELSADTALLIAESYTGLLSDVAEGSLLLDDFVAMLPQ